MGNRERQTRPSRNQGQLLKAYFTKRFPSFKKQPVREALTWKFLRTSLLASRPTWRDRLLPWPKVCSLPGAGFYRSWELIIPLFQTSHSGVSRSEYWHPRNLQTPQIAPDPEPVTEHLPTHRGPNWPPLTLLALLTSGLVLCQTHWPMPRPLRLTAVPIREITCLPRLDYACPRPVHAKYICYSNYGIR